MNTVERALIRPAAFRSHATGPALGRPRNPADWLAHGTRRVMSRPEIAACCAARTAVAASGAAELARVAERPPAAPGGLAR